MIRGPSVGVPDGPLRVGRQPEGTSAGGAAGRSPLQQDTLLAVRGRLDRVSETIRRRLPAHLTGLIRRRH